MVVADKERLETSLALVLKGLYVRQVLLVRELRERFTLILSTSFGECMERSRKSSGFAGKEDQLRVNDAPY